MAKKVGGGGAIMQPYDKNGEYDFNEEGVEPERVVKAKTPEDAEREKFKKTLQEPVGEKRDDSKTNNVLNSNRVDYYKYLTQDGLKNCIEAGTPEMANITNELFLNDSYGLGKPPFSGDSFFSSAYNKVSYHEGKDEDSIHCLGEVFYHESWHAIDYNYSDGSNVDFPKKNRLSTSYILSTGKTLHQTFVEEFTSANVAMVKQDFEQDRISFWAKQGVDYNKVKKDYDWYMQERHNIYIRIYNQTNDLKKAKEEKDKFITQHKSIEDTYWKVQGNVDFKRRWASMSDVCSGATKDKDSLDVSHHPAKYWRETIYNRGIEVFAEFAASKATNPESHQLLRKYLPNTAKAFDEIFENLRKGVIKPNGSRKTWRP